MSQPVRVIVAISLLFAILIGAGTALSYATRLQADIQRRTIEIGGVFREYRLVIPYSARDKENLPLLIALHGALDTTDEMAHYTQLDILAAQEGCLLVYLQGRLLNWPPSIPEVNPDIAVPDLEFFDEICDQMVDRYHVDSNRIHLAGVSQGGGMCNLIVSQRSERLASAVCNCGWMPKPLDVAPLTTTNKCPMLFIVGSQDTQVPPEVVRTASRIFEAGGHPIEFRLLDGAGHGWNNNFGVNRILWNFVRDKRREVGM